MRKRLTESQIVAILKEAEAGISVPESMPQSWYWTEYFL